MLKVSIIVPVYNAEDTLVRCLKSLVQQTYKNIEIILINDGSTDNSQKICEQYVQDYPYVVLLNQNNSGPATARNRGIDNAKGDYLSFVDADDYVEHSMIKDMMEVIEKNNADMVICGFYHETTDGKRMHEFKYAPGLYQGKAITEIAIDLISDVSEKRIPPYSWVRMIRKDIFNKPIIRYADGMIRSEDYYLYTQLHFRIKKLYLLSDKPLYHYMENNNSITHRYVKNYWESVRVMYCELIKQLPDQENVKKNLSVMLLQRSLIALNNSSRCEEFNIFKEEIKNIISDSVLGNVVKQIDFKEGVRLFGLYYLFLKFHAYGLVYLRYLGKRVKLNKTHCPDDVK